MDPIVLYVIVREELQMSPGKIAAQVGHGIQKVILHYFKVQLVKAKLHCDMPKDEVDHIAMINDWMANSSRKVVLKADEKEWKKLKEEFKDCVIVVDAGFTEVEPNTETVICLWPRFKSQASKTIKRLQAL